MHITRLICRGILGLPLWMIRAQNKRVTKWSVIAIITIIHNSCVHGHARSSVGLYWVAYYIPAGASDPENEIKWNLLVIAKDRTFLIQHAAADIAQLALHMRWDIGHCLQTEKGHVTNIWQMPIISIWKQKSMHSHWLFWEVAKPFECLIILENLFKFDKIHISNHFNEIKGEL